MTLSMLVTSASVIACTDNGTPAEGDVAPAPTDEAEDERSTPNRPAFEAGFPDRGDAGSTETSTSCTDPNDPGSAENTSKVLPNTDDSQNAPVLVQGTMNGPVDVDFYKVTVADTFFASIDPSFEMNTADVEMCVFVRCQGDGETTVSGCKGGTAATSEIGSKGCCATGVSSATPVYDCPGFTDDDSADFYIRIKQTGNGCVPYSFSYAF